MCRIIDENRMYDKGLLGQRYRTPQEAMIDECGAMVENDD
jgi:hypothetical protein